MRANTYMEKSEILENGAPVLLDVSNLKTYFRTEEGIIKAVDGISFKLRKGENLCIVGESGSGKSVTSLSIMRLIPNPPGKIVDGRILFEDEDLAQKSEKEMKAIRGREISMIFQEPMTSLNPIMTVGKQVIEAIMLHQRVSAAQAREEATEMFIKVGIPMAKARMNAYPHQLSGGMRQRVMIAMALVCNPKLLIADEPTTALDVTIQAQILDLMKRLRSHMGTSIILITHDMGIVAGMADDVLVMYAGRIMEQGDVRSIFKDARHPYTKGLLDSIPKINEDRDRLPAIEGVVPNQLNMPAGCPFEPRCSLSSDKCREEMPPLAPIGDKGRMVACWNANLEPSVSDRRM
ncbi:MAG: ABC transporter ATP-binding protein [Rectinema sp.]|jgi:oligopeptide/dipeptide ABC transporter ATP-binding protein